MHFFGIGSIIHLREILETEHTAKIFLVVDNNSYSVCGAETALQDLLSGYQVMRFSEFEPNPKIEDVQKGIQMFQKFEPDVVVAIGGGSVIDMAKSINLLSHQKGDIVEYVEAKRKAEVPGKPLVAVPTTSGTGSEATHFAVVYIGKEKHSLAHESMLPEYSIVDPQFTFSLPASVAAATGMDALAQAIESFWNVKSTKESKEYAREAIPLILENLSDAVNKATKESKVAMSRAAYLSGKAINITTTTACHSISYPITSYFNVAHGHACALTLAEILEFNSRVDKTNCEDKRGVEYVQDMMQELVGLLGDDNVADVKETIENLMEEIDLETRLGELNITDTELIIEHGFNPERMKNNPRKVEADDVRAILKNIL